MVRLLNVQAVFSIESGKDTFHSNVLEEFVDESIEYAILSHRWGKEVNYDEMVKLNTMTKEERDKIREHQGYRKILKSCELAAKDGFRWLWVDTCCIDRRSSSELSEAIRSMYRWYENSKKCYAYLHDVERRTFPTKQDNRRYNNSTGWPEWFSRGWTLQELIAPTDVQFFNKEWAPLGSKHKHASTLHKITRIPESVLKGTLSPGQVCVAQIMSWAAVRQTTRVEDRAYSLLGLFGVNMPMLYGEGNKAFQRLQLEIIRVSNDQSIFAWDPNGRIRRSGLVLADDPSYFQDCHDVRMVGPDDFIKSLKHQLQFDKRDIPGEWRPASAQQLHKYTVTNGGIEICMPLTPYNDFPTIYRATLACMQRDGPLLTIDLESRGSNYYRAFGATNISQKIPEFSDLYLACHRDPKCCIITLDERTMPHYGFTRCGAFPPVINGDCVALSSLTSDLIVMVYSSAKVKARFAVGLGYYFREQWVHVVCDDEGDSDLRPEDYAKKVHTQLWNARAKLARHMPHEQHRLLWSPFRTEVDCYIKHAHLPRSIYAAKIIYGEWKEGYTTVTIDVDQCTGCCYGPLKWKTTANATDGLSMSGLLKVDSANNHGHWLLVDGIDVQFLECTTQKIALGDYGDWDYNSEGFAHKGNIFEDLELLPDTLDIDTVNSVHLQVKRMVSSFDGRDEIGDLVETFTSLSTRPALVLHRPIGLSLPNSRQLVLLLKALSTRLADQYLVTTVVQCSAYRTTNPGSEWTGKNETGESGPSESREFLCSMIARCSKPAR
ncbi:heterokaryon incompatibility protein-domain-containing protein [Pisolithus tinctorius]|nr:heterokaryon incompatibility protein-domain-containing protein [Pisolithus tinctorius]